MGTSALIECVWTQPITASENDTIETIRQIASHNAKYEANCLND